MANKYGTVSTTHLSNILGLPFSRQYLDLCLYLSGRETSIVKTIKELLGKQDHCWVGGSQNRRFYIWKFREMWILVHNEKGLCFEVPTYTTKEEASILWNDICSKLGFSIQ
jgi:hypothetical protein